MHLRQGLPDRRGRQGRRPGRGQEARERRLGDGLHERDAAEVLLGVESRVLRVPRVRHLARPGRVRRGVRLRGHHLLLPGFH
eukprot:1909883-Pyramimonas_sp.AAC.1